MSSRRRAGFAFLLTVVLAVAFGAVAHVTLPAVPQVTMAAAVLPSPSPTPTTHPGETTAERGYALQARLNALLDDAEKALKAKDQEGFVRLAQTDSTRKELVRRYNNLLALQVTQFSYYVKAIQFDAASSQWNATVMVSFCFVVHDCDNERLDETMMWADRETGPELMSVAAPKAAEQWFGAAQPWELSDLQVLVGNRVLVATTARLANRLPQLLREAEEAAIVADTFITAGRKPTIYRVYLADKEDWKIWYDGEPVSWAAGYARATGTFQSDVVVNNAKVRGSFYSEHLRHELTHVATVRGTHYWKDNWWLIEGIADLASGEQYSGSAWAAETRNYVRGKWDKKLPTVSPGSKATASEARSRYGVAYLAMRGLDGKFGRAKVIEFFTKVVVVGGSAQTAAMPILGVTWEDLESYLLSYIKSNA